MLHSGLALEISPPTIHLRANVGMNHSTFENTSDLARLFDIFIAQRYSQVVALAVQQWQQRARVALAPVGGARTHRAPHPDRAPLPGTPRSRRSAANGCCTYPRPVAPSWAACQHKPRAFSSETVQQKFPAGLGGGAAARLTSAAPHRQFCQDVIRRQAALTCAPQPPSNSLVPRWKSGSLRLPR